MASPPGGGWPTMPIKLCPYWNRETDEHSAYCEYMDERDNTVLWDQVKICGVRDDIDFEDLES